MGPLAALPAALGGILAGIGSAATAGAATGTAATLIGGAAAASTIASAATLLKGAPKAPTVNVAAPIAPPPSPAPIQPVNAGQNSSLAALSPGAALGGTASFLGSAGGNNQKSLLGS